MAESILMTKAYGTTLGPRRVVLGTSNTIGTISPDPTAEYYNDGSNVQMSPSNYTLQINLNTIVTWIGNKVYRTTDGGTNWYNVHTLSNSLYTAAQPNNYGHTGLHVVMATDPSDSIVKPTIIGMFVGAPQYIYGLKSYDLGATFTDAYIGSTYNNNNKCGGQCISHNNAVYWVHVTDSGSPRLIVLSWNPTSGFAVNNINYGTDAPSGYSLCVARNKLFLLFGTSGGYAAMFRDDDWGTPKMNVAPGTASSYGGKPFFVGDDGNLYYLLGGMGNGWRAYKITLNSNGDMVGEWTEITNPVIPAGLRSGQGNYIRGWVVTENQSNPGGTPVTYIYLSSLQSSARDCYQWVNGSTVMTYKESGSTAAGFVPANQPCGGGDRLWTPDEPSIRRYGAPRRVSGGMELAYYVKTYDDAENMKVRIYYSLVREPAKTVATLKSTDTGTLSEDKKDVLLGTNTANGRLIKIVWDLPTDSIADGTPVSIFARLYK